MSSDDVQRQIANSHSIFNIVNLLIFLPFTTQFGSLVKRILPDTEKMERRAHYLDDEVLDVPELAINQAKNEVLRMAKIIKDRMLPELLELVKTGEEPIKNKIRESELTIDFLYKSVTRYLARISQRNLSEGQSEQQVRLLYVCNDMEHAGDVMMSMIQIAEKMEQQGMELSVEGWQELSMMHQSIKRNFENAVEAFENEDEDLATQVIRLNPEVAKMEKSLRYSHFNRLQQSEKTLETSSVHMDLINNLLRINGHALSIAQATIGII